jgi:single-strand DNA-binding protein
VENAARRVFRRWLRYGPRTIDSRIMRGSGSVAMSGSVNKVILIGNLGRDPEVRRLNSGDPVVNFSVATTESWRDKASGEKRDRTEWHNVVIFNENLGRIAEQYLRKGSKVYLEGQLQTREYTDKDGNQRKTTEVVLQRFRGELTLLDSRGRGADAGGDDGGYGESFGGGGDRPSFGRSSPMERRPASAGTGGGRPSNPIDDDIPF